MVPPSTSASPNPPAVSASAGKFFTDLGSGLLDFTGADAEVFLQGQLSNDLKNLESGAVQLSSYNSPKGRMLATLVLWRDGDALRALVAADLVESLRKRLSMYVMRSKVSVADVSTSHVLLGVGGEHARDAVRTACGEAPDPGRVIMTDAQTLVGLPDGRIVVIAPVANAEDLRRRLAAATMMGSADEWRWLGIRAGVPTIRTATQDLFVPQTANWDVLGGISFQKGCYPGQEIVARTQYLGRLKERLQLFHVDATSPLPGTRIYGIVFSDQACGAVVDAASAPDGGCDLLAVLQLSALEGMLHLGAPDGPLLTPLPLPYALPAPVASNRPRL